MERNSFFSFLSKEGGGIIKVVLVDLMNYTARREGLLTPHVSWLIDNKKGTQSALLKKPWLEYGISSIMKYGTEHKWEFSSLQLSGSSNSNHDAPLSKDITDSID